MSRSLDRAAGSVKLVAQHNGSVLKLRKLAADYDPTQRMAAMGYLQERQAAGEIVTGLLYLDDDPDDLHDRLQTTRKPLNALCRRRALSGKGRT